MVALPEEAFDTTLRLNNRYFLDGRDANSFTNVGWIYGLHDRPWFGRPVFGNVRSMGANSLRKFDADAYVRTVETLALEEAGERREPQTRVAGCRCDSVVPLTTNALA